MRQNNDHSSVGISVYAYFKLNVKVNSKDFVTVIDTGAEVTII